MSHKKLYATARWKETRSLQLAMHPLCGFCKAKGRITRATVADHIIPHRGDHDLFFHGELQSLCDKCHSQDKQRIELGLAPIREIGLDGIPEGWQ